MKHVTWKGELLNELDLANSQWPFLLYCLDNQQMDNLVSIFAHTYRTVFMSEADFVQLRTPIEWVTFYKEIANYIPHDVLNN